jgi:hypothetical protein
MTKMRPSKPDLPKQIADAIRKAWPDGIIDMPDMDDAPFWGVYPKTKDEFVAHSGNRRTL